MLRPLAHPVACCVLLVVVAQSLKPAPANGRNIVSQQLPTFLGFVASICLSLTFQKKRIGERTSDLRRNCYWALNITIPWKFRVYSAQPVFGDQLESPPSVNQIFSFWLVTHYRALKVLALASSMAFCGSSIFAKAYNEPVTSLHEIPSREFNIDVVISAFLL